MNRLKSEEGSSLVEFALSACMVLAALLGTIQLSLAFYTFNYVSDAARVVTRYAVMRGPDSCTLDSVVDPNCNMNPSRITSSTDPTKNPLLAYLASAGFLKVDSGNVSVVATWLIPSQDASNATTWTTACPNPTTNLDANGNPCNAVGNAVKVVVTYNFGLVIPFWNRVTLPITSTSQMVMSQ
jgi:Flp pilus assembly protein TadG